MCKWELSRVPSHVEVKTIQEYMFESTILKYGLLSIIQSTTKRKVIIYSSIIKNSTAGVFENYSNVNLFAFFFQKNFMILAKGVMKTAIFIAKTMMIVYQRKRNAKQSKGDHVFFLSCSEERNLQTVSPHQEELNHGAQPK